MTKRRRRQGHLRENGTMETKRFIYYEGDGLFVGRLEEYPDYRTQGETMDQLQEHLLELLLELLGAGPPCCLASSLASYA